MTQESSKTLRGLVIEAAHSWLSTPYHHKARLKGVGCDCVMLLAGVAEEAGVTGHVEVPDYPVQWHLHQRRQILVEELEKYCDRTTEPLPGNFVTFWFGHTYSHSAIIVEWPICIHASMKAKCVEIIDALRDPQLSRCKREFWQPRAYGSN